MLGYGNGNSHCNGCINDLEVNALASHLCDPSSILMIDSGCIWRSPTYTRGLSPGTLASSHINDLIELASVLKRDINRSCRTCLSITVKKKVTFKINVVT